MRRAFILVVGVLSLAACTASRPAAEQEPPATALSSPLHRDSLARLPAYLVPAPAGSTPRQRRQWQRAQAANLTHAGVLPAKLKNSSLATAPGAVATTVTKPRAPVATGTGTATDNRKAGQRGGSAATAPNAVASTTNPTTGLSYWWLLVLVAGLLWWQRKRIMLLLS